MVQFTVQAFRQGQPLWQVFWMGGTLKTTPEPAAVSVRPDVVSPGAMIWGVTLPWNLIVSTALGIWLMFAPFAFGSAGMAAHSDHLIGALIVTAAVIALADVGRSTRFINVLFGAWIIVAPWVLGGATSDSTWNDLIVGSLVILLSFPRGRIGDQYGSFDRYIR